MASDLKVVSIPEDRFNDVIIHLRENFFADEPLNKAVNLCKRGEPHVALERHSLATLEQGFSRMAITENGVHDLLFVCMDGFLFCPRQRVFKADATGAYSQKVCTNFGFLMEAEIEYCEIDERIRPAPPHKALKLMAKILE